MSTLMLATADTEFEQRVRAAFKGRFDGQLRYWREGMLTDEPSRMIEELGHRGAEVVAIGPGIAPDMALQLAERSTMTGRTSARSSWPSRRHLSCNRRSTPAHAT